MRSKRALFSGLADAMGGTDEAVIAANAIGYGGSAFLLAALARAIVQQHDPSDSYAGVNATEHLNTTMSDSVVSNSLNKELSKSVNKQSKTASDFIKWSVPIGAAVLGGGIGYKLVDDAYDSYTAKKLKEEKALLAALHKKIVMARALNARGQLSNEMYNDILKEAQPLLAKQAMDRHRMRKLASGSGRKSDIHDDWIQPALGLALSVALASTAYGVYAYQAGRNPDRLRYKAIKSGLGEYAMQQSVMRPIEYSLTDDPKVMRMLEEIEAKKKASPTETPMIQTSVTI